MALVSGGRSSLNPNAPLFIPAAVRQVEDFSPEWWNLVTTAAWFRDFWLSEHQEEDIFGEEKDGNDVVESPDNFDLGVDEEILNMEAQFEEFLQSADYHGSMPAKGITETAHGKNTRALVKNLSMPKERQRGGEELGEASQDCEPQMHSQIDPATSLRSKAV